MNLLPNRIVGFSITFLNLTLFAFYRLRWLYLVNNIEVA